jgi:hypothetical protein
LNEAFQDAALDAAGATVDRPLEINLEEIEAEESRPGEDGVGAGLFMGRERTSQSVLEGIELEEVRVSLDEPLAINMEEVTEALWPEEEEEEEEAGAGFFMNLSRERTTLHEM